MRAFSASLAVFPAAGAGDAVVVVFPTVVMPAAPVVAVVAGGLVSVVLPLLASTLVGFVVAALVVEVGEEVGGLVDVVDGTDDEEEERVDRPCAEADGVSLPEATALTAPATSRPSMTTKMAGPTCDRIDRTSAVAGENYRASG